MSASTITVKYPTALADAVSAGITQLVDTEFASRLFAHDITLWGKDAAEEAAVRLNWTDAVDRAQPIIEQAAELRTVLQAEGFDQFLLCGMGGSSLGAEMLVREAGLDNLTVLDSTHPDVVASALNDLARTIVIASSKSGTTVETRAHLAAAEEAFERSGVAAQNRIVVITDPGTDLDVYAHRAGYAVFHADPNIGGRFSVLTAFGLVPAVLAGANVEELIAEAARVTAADAIDSVSVDSAENPAFILAAAAVATASSFELYANGHGREFGFAEWLEQLVAESTGKHGKGVLPVVLWSGSGSGRAEQRIRMSGSLGAMILVCEVATAAMGYLLDVNPFDQPDVESSKQAARELLNTASDQGTAPKDNFLSPAEVVHALRATVQPGAYLALDFFAPASDLSDVAALQKALREVFNVPVTVGRGPRFLHSTGQLHKGGPRNGVFVQIVSEFDTDMAIPGELFTFGQLFEAQASGDANVLAHTGQPVFRIRGNAATIIQEFQNALK